jgi:prevent-host-death family protein
MYYTDAMEQIPIRSLNQDTAGVLARVEQGEVVEVTNRGRPIARIVPISDDTLAELIAAGTVTPPTIAAPFPMPTVSADESSESGQLITDLRDEERW